MLNKLKRAALGAHTPHDKATAASKPVPMPLPAQVRILMSQHIGAPAKALVKKGDEVFVGTKIGEAGGFVSANIHSSVSGTVAAVEPFRLSNGRMCDSVVIKTDGKQTVDPAVKAPEVTDKASFLAAVRACGLVGLGGAGFPTDVKLQPKPPVDTLLINASECEVWLTSDTQEMLNCSDDIIRGIEAVLKYVGIPKCVIGIENNKPEAIKKLTEMVKDEPKITVCPLLTKYPQGGERQLIYATTGRAINSTMLPADAGCVVDNVDTVIAVYEAVILGKPVMDRIVTVTGQGIKNPQNFDVLSGTDMAELIEAAGGLTDNVSKVISGGPMMGFAMYDTHVPCIKTSSACLCLEKDDVADAEQTACINCGRCVGVCPGHVIPARLATFAEHGDMKSFQKFDGMECCECGCCSYICPAKRPLTQMIKSMRKMVLASRKKK